MANKKNPVWLDDDRVRTAFVNANTMTDIIRNLNQPLGSASFLNVKKAANRLGLTLPQGSDYRKTLAARLTNTTPLEQILIANSTYINRQSLKKRLVKAGLKEDKCEICGQGPTWNNKPLVLQLDHINGIGDDNRIDNLRIVCPNCHTQTDTFAYRNGKRVVGIPC